MTTKSDKSATEQGLTEEDLERIREYLNRPALQRTPDILCPADE